MLLNFKVKNFRSIKDEVVLDLQATLDKTLQSEAVVDYKNVAVLKCAAIYGPNASGKSNLLKAFAVFRSMILESLLRSNLPSDLANEFFKLSEETENKPSFFEITFICDGEIFSYGFEIDKKQVIAEWLKVAKGKKTMFERKKQVIESNKNYFTEASMELKKQVSERVLFLSLLASHKKPISEKIVKFLQKTNVIFGAARGQTLNYSFNQFLSNPLMTNQIKDLIIQSDLGITDIQANENIITAQEIRNIPDKFKPLLFEENSKIAQRSLKCLHKKYSRNGKELASIALDFFAEESDGTQQMFALSAPILDSLESGKILFIDEVESSLHPILCQYVVAIFNSKEKNPKNAQLIFTTHAIPLLDEELLRRDEIYFTEKNKYGATELFSLYDLERTGVNFAKRYLEGRYQAIPYIKDFEKLKSSK